jgi:hypothetical protein
MASQSAAAGKSGANAFQSTQTMMNHFDRVETEYEDFLALYSAVLGITIQ